MSRSALLNMPAARLGKAIGMSAGMRRRDEIAAVHDAPLLDLVFHAAAVHRQHNDPSMVR